MTRQTDTCTPTRNSVGLPLENGALEAEGISSAPDALPLRGSPAFDDRGALSAARWPRAAWPWAGFQPPQLMPPYTVRSASSSTHDQAHTRTTKSLACSTLRKKARLTEGQAGGGTC